jgi:hypothetical protein
VFSQVLGRSIHFLVIGSILHLFVPHTVAYLVNSVSYKVGSILSQGGN